MKKPVVHLICNAHLDPVWQWRWEEGCGEALATFGSAVEILEENPDLIFNHNEALLYMWVRRYAPVLFKRILELVRKGRWAIAGGWYLQPDVNLPGIESIIRQISVGRRFFRKFFECEPRVAYNFDSFGHSGGLPQVLSQAGYEMYIHMRPQPTELDLPSDLYRWRGVDGSEILGLRIAVGLYHTERDNISQRLKQATALALKLKRDVPLFWGLGDHGGGATCQELKTIKAFRAKEKCVEIIHSTPDRLYEALKEPGAQAPLVQGDLQRVFTGCYSSISRLKRRSARSLGTLVQTEALRAITWFSLGKKYPGKELARAWKDHLLNDFHDIISGSCIEPAEKDALDLYGKTDDAARRLRLGAAAALNSGPIKKCDLPLTLLNSNTAATFVPVEAESMLDYRPRWTGTWHLRLFRADGSEAVCQEEQPESLLPFNGWRRKVSFMAELPGVGASHYYLKVAPGKKKSKPCKPAHAHVADKKTGLVKSLPAGQGRECLNGHLFQPLVIEDKGDAWGTDIWNYRRIIGHFKAQPPAARLIQQGPIRNITETVMYYGKSRIIMDTIAYGSFPVLEFRMRIHWNEEQKMLKLSVPTVFKKGELVCEVPGGLINRPADGQEHVFGRWFMVHGSIKERPAALAVVCSGQHGLDFQNGEVRLTLLRSAAYCHEKSFDLGRKIQRKYMDQGVHEIRLLAYAGDTVKVRCALPGLAGWLNSPPAVYSHLPYGITNENADFLAIEPENIEMTACKRSFDGKTLVIRLQEKAGLPTGTEIKLKKPMITVKLAFKPLEIKTIRVETSGEWAEVDLLNEV